MSVGGEDLEMLAESPRKIVARNTSKQVGLSELEVNERDQTARGEFRTLGIKLSAPKLDLLRGEQTTLIVTVTGLEGIKEVVPLELENKSSSVIQMAGGEVQRINISPSQVQGGTYTTERPLTGVQRGAFTIIGTVTGGRRIIEQTPKIAGGGPQVSNNPPGYTLCGAICGSPRVEQGTSKVSCRPSSTCTQAGCRCRLFRHKKGAPPAGKSLEDVADQGADPVDQEAGFTYVCRCVK